MNDNYDFDFWVNFPFAQSVEEDSEELAEKIEKCYRRYNVHIKITKCRFTDEKIVFKFKLLKITTYNDVRKHERDVRYRLKLAEFYIDSKEENLYFIVSKGRKQTIQSLTKILDSQFYAESIKKLTIAHILGVDTTGRLIIQDLTKYPHAVIAGTTGSGKSVAIKSLIFSLLHSYSPERINLVLGDMAGDLSLFNDLPHLSCPVITNSNDFLEAMSQLKVELDRRIQLKGTMEYSKMPYILCVIDEFSAFISGEDAKQKVSREIITEILRRGRHAKIHFILAAHNPTKANLKFDLADLPTRISFRVAQLSNSLAILNTGGAEKLSGKGAMIFKSSQDDENHRIQGVYISDETLREELTGIHFNCLLRNYECQYKFTIDLSKKNCELLPNTLIRNTKSKNKNEKLATVLAWALGQSTISSNEIIQRERCGWSTAKKIMTQLEDLGVVSPLEAKLRRDILPKSVDDLSDDLINILKDNGYTIDDIFTPCSHSGA